jgi:hypothetical protein
MLRCQRRRVLQINDIVVRIVVRILVLLRCWPRLLGTRSVFLLVTDTYVLGKVHL